MMGEHIYLERDFGRTGREARGILFPFLAVVVLHPRSFAHSFFYSPAPTPIKY